MRQINNIIKNTLPIMGEGWGEGLLLILLLLAMLMPQQVWAYENITEWTLVGTKYGTCGNSDNTVISYDGLNNTAWGSYSILDTDNLPSSGWKGTVFRGSCATPNQKFISFSIYKHEEVVGNYRKLKLSGNIDLVMATDRYTHGAGLYMFDDLESAQKTALDATANQSEVTPANTIMKSTDNTSKESLNRKYYTTIYDNSTSANSQTITKYLVLVHVNSNGDNPATLITTAGTQEWASFWMYDKYETTSISSVHITFDANGGTGSMDKQSIEASGNLAANSFTRKGYHFKCWNEKADGTGKDYSNKATFSGHGLVTLYAQWEKHTDSGSYDTNGFGVCSTCHEGTIYQPLTQSGSDYLITNKGQLLYFGQNGTSMYAEASIKVTNDLDMSGYNYEYPFYASMEDYSDLSYNSGTITYAGFSGTFDGQGHTISNLNVPFVDGRYSAGLVGNNSGTIKNLILKGYYFKDTGSKDGRFGAICGVNFGTVENCGVVGSTVYKEGKVAGAITGANYGGTIKNCYSKDCTIGKHQRLGNLVGDGRNDNNSLLGKIISCYSDGELEGTTGDAQHGTTCTGEANVADADFENGRVAYLLTGGLTDCNQSWYQTIGTDTYPVLISTGNNTVYNCYADCAATTQTYSNVYHPNPGHSYTNYVYNNDVTCTKAGTQTASCDYACGKTQTQTDADHPALGHSKPSDFDSNGLKICSQCGETDCQSATDNNSDGIYEIGNAGQLITFSDYVSGRQDNKFHMDCDAELTADIEFPDGITLKPIGARQIGSNGTYKDYTGTFNGNGHTIRNLKMEALSINGTYHASMFDGLSGATVQNVNFEGMYGTTPSAYGNFAFLTTSADSSTISNILVQGNAKVMDWNGTYAALADAATNCHVRNCGVVVDFSMSMTNNTSTSTNRYAAGFCKTATNTDFTNCYFDGKFSDVTWIRRGYYVGSKDSIYNGTYMYPFCKKAESGVTYTNCYTVPSQNEKGFDYTYCPEAVTVLPKSDFQCGKVCYLLNGGKTNDGSACKTDGTQAWYQNIDNEATKTGYPVLKGAATLYWGYSDCYATSVNVLSNTCQVHTTEGHSFGTQVAQVDPTCTTTGFKAHYVCGYCAGKYYVDNAMHTTSEIQEPVIAKYGHGYNGHADEALRGYTPTYVWSGTHDAPACTFTLLCNKCQVKMKDAVSLTPAEVSAQHVNAKCTQDGNATYSVTGTYSGTGNASFSSTDTHDYVISALGHHNTYGLCDRCWSELPTAENYTITESEGWGHTRTLECTVDNGICYVRPFAAETWASWFVPFDLSYDDQCRLGLTAAYVESIHNYDDNLDGKAERTVLNVMLLTGGKLKAGVPYLVKFDEEVTGKIETNSHTLHTAADVQSVSVQSGSYIYSIAGNYSKKEASEMASGTHYSVADGQMKQWTEALAPFRWSIAVSDRNVVSAAPTMRIRVIGEEDYETGIRTMYADNQCREYDADGLFDLSGRRQTSGKGLQIKNGKTIMMK